MDVSIIIVNYNTCQMTKECIDSIFEKTQGLSFEVILVDNASNDGSKEFFEKETRIRYVYSYENMGFGRANNVGMMLAKGKYFFLLNSDTLLMNNAIHLFFNYAEEHEQKAFYGAWLEDKDGIRVHSFARMPTPQSILKESFCMYYWKLTGKSKEVYSETYTMDLQKEVGFITGADLFMHRSVYEQIGGFDHNIFMYCEESDLQYRALQVGYKSYIINGPRIIHLEGQSNLSKKDTKKTNSKYAIGLRSKLYYVKKHTTWWQYILFRSLYAITMTPYIFFASETKKGDYRQSLKVLYS